MNNSVLKGINQPTVWLPSNFRARLGSYMLLHILVLSWTHLDFSEGRFLVINVLEVWKNFADGLFKFRVLPSVISKLYRFVKPQAITGVRSTCAHSPDYSLHSSPFDSLDSFLAQFVHSWYLMELSLVLEMTKKSQRAQPSVKIFIWEPPYAGGAYCPCLICSKCRVNS